MNKIILVFLSFFILIPGFSFAQTEPQVEVSVSPSPAAVPVEYTLPYPGILPGNPLYSLKAARDRIVDFFITDSLKKSNYYLLQADKRLASSLLLFDQGKDELGETTLSKGQNYLEKSFAKALSAQKQRQEIGEVLSKIKNSSIKHTAEIKKLIDKTSGETKKRLEGDLKRAEEFEKEVSSIKP